MNLVFIENARGSGQTIIVSEAFEHCVVSHRLEPGDSARIAMSRFKSIVIDDEAVATQGLEKSSADSDGSSPPAGPRRRGRGGRSLVYRLRRSVGREVRASDQDHELKKAERTALSK